MPKKKNYRFAGDGKECPCTPVAFSSADVASINCSSSRSATDADIDLRALLGAEARMPTSLRTLKLRPALGRGVDDWVFASADAIRSLLRSGRSPATAGGYATKMLCFFDYLTNVPSGAGAATSRPSAPKDLSPLHVTQFIAWIKKRGHEEGWSTRTIRMCYFSVKSVLKEMFEQGVIEGKAHRFFKRNAFERDPDESRHRSMSGAEQERLASAIKADLSAIYHGRLKVTMREVQALRLLVVAHRMGHNTTPLLELARDAMRPGLLPGTILLRTTKFRNRSVLSQVGRTEPVMPTDDDQSEAAESGSAHLSGDQPEDLSQHYLPFSYAEGGVIQQAISLTQHLVEHAPKRIRNRVWLYVVSHSTHAVRQGVVSCLTSGTLQSSINAVVRRHLLLGDDGNPLTVNTSRFRKSRFDRVDRITDGDIAITANLMGNTPAVAAVDYPSMNRSRQAEAAGFMNQDYVALMRKPGAASAPDHETAAGSPSVIDIKPVEHVPTQTPVSGCNDVLGGEHAPKNGRPCDRFVMCLFCASFAIVGTVDELWRLFSFQVFARAELSYLDEALGPLPSDDELLEDLRDRYRLAIPYIDSFTQRQFAASRVVQARSRTAAGLHPFWQQQLKSSRSARNAGSQTNSGSGPEPKFNEDGLHGR